MSHFLRLSCKLYCYFELNISKTGGGGGRAPPGLDHLPSVSTSTSSRVGRLPPGRNRSRFTCQVEGIEFSARARECWREGEQQRTSLQCSSPHKYRHDLMIVALAYA